MAGAVLEKKGTGEGARKPGIVCCRAGMLGRPSTGTPACCSRVPLQTVTTAYAHVAMLSPRLDDEIERIGAVGEGSWNAPTRPRTWTLSDDGGVAPALAGPGRSPHCASTDGLPPFFLSLFEHFSWTTTPEISRRVQVDSLGGCAPVWSDN